MNARIAVLTLGVGVGDAFGAAFRANRQVFHRSSENAAPIALNGWFGQAIAPFGGLPTSSLTESLLVRIPVYGELSVLDRPLVMARS